ncbi:hypothetical protein [Curtobacterium flaccumfaciens]|uniref:hypothetical protein n=1 Tax=Curtobacterium flaccumfaciens TaxID=2035 RepID=UPI0037BE6E06
MTEIVRFSRATDYILGGMFSFFIIGSALLALPAGPGMLAVTGLMVLLWWRALVLKVVFSPRELVLVGIVSVKRIPKSDVLRIEQGSTVVFTRRGRERRVIIPIALSASHITDNTPDAQVKQRIDAASRRWLIGEFPDEQWQGCA